MIASGPLKHLIESFAQLHGLALQVWSPAGNLDLSVGPGSEAADEGSRLGDLAKRALEKGELHEAVDGRWAAAMPFMLPSAERYCLVACRAAKDPAANGAADLLPVVRSFRDLLEEQLALYDDTDKLTSELERSYEDLYLFARIATRIRTLRFAGPMLKELVADLLDTMRADLAIAKMTDRPGYDVIVRRSGTPCAIDDVEGFVARVLENIREEAPSFEESCAIVNDSRSIPFFRDLAPLPYRLLAVEVRHEDTVYGWLVLVSCNMDEIFRRGEYRLLNSMAEQLALVIANSDLYDDLEQFIVNLVRSLVHAIEAKDVYTRGHSERVSRISMSIGRKLGLGEDDMGRLQWASMLHDIGKIGTSEAILNKPGKLNEEEFDHIKMHPSRGAAILEPIQQLAESLPGILHHHERYDGTGYPDGLAGEQTPYLARIIGVADTYDALTSDRAYRAAIATEKARDIIRECAGTQLDPAVVQAFEELADADALPPPHAAESAPVTLPLSALGGDG